MTREEKYHHGDLRHSLIEEAMQMIGEVGVQGITVRNLSKRLGVSHTAPYRHFPDKKSLLCAVAAEGFRRQANVLKATVNPQLSLVEQLEVLAFTYVKFAIENATFYRLMYASEEVGNEPTEELRNAATESTEVVLAVFNAAIVKEQLPAVSAQDYFIVLWTVVHGLSMLLIQGQVNRTSDETNLHTILSEQFASTGIACQYIVTKAITMVISGFFKKV